MKGKFVTQEIICDFKEHLIWEERSAETVEKYTRDVKASSVFAGDMRNGYPHQRIALYNVRGCEMRKGYCEL